MVAQLGAFLASRYLSDTFSHVRPPNHLMIWQSLTVSSMCNVPKIDHSACKMCTQRSFTLKHTCFEEQFLVRVRTMNHTLTLFLGNNLTSFDSPLSAAIHPGLTKSLCGINGSDMQTFSVINSISPF